MSGTIVELWQPNWVNLPELVQDQPTDWDDGGTPGMKFVQGVIIEADSLNVSKSFQVQSADDLTIRTPLEAPATWNGQSTISFSFATPFLAHAMRVISTDGISWRRWRVSFVFVPYPEINNNWQTEKLSFGMRGWGHIPWVNLCHLSSTDLILTLTPDNGNPVSVTVPNSAGVQKKTLVTLPINKFKVASLDVSAGSGASNPVVLELANIGVFGYGGPTLTYGCYFDHDGVTAWQFGDPFDSHFARNNLADGSIIANGDLGVGSLDPDLNFGTTMWLQDDATPNHYYTLSNGKLFKLHVRGGVPYMTQDASLTITAVNTFVYWCLGKSGGTRYIIIYQQVPASPTFVRVFAVNADSMAIVGHYDHPAAVPNIGQPFMDASGVFWFALTGNPNGVDLVSWNPPDGATGGILNVTAHNVSAATLGTTNHIVSAVYNSANNTVVLGTQGTSGNATTGDLVAVSLTTFLQVAIRLDDGLFFFVGSFTVPGQGGSSNDGAITAFENGLIGGKLMIEQDTSHAIQVGGLVALIDPVAFTASFTMNVSAVIHAAHLAHPTQVPDDVPLVNGKFGQFADLRYSAANGGSLLITYDAQEFGSFCYYITNVIPAVGNPFRIFEADCEVAVGQWNRSGRYQIVKPFGGPTAPGAKV